MNYTQRLLLFLLLSWLLPAQGILRNSVAALNYPGVPASDHEASPASCAAVSDDRGSSAKFSLVRGAPTIAGVSLLPRASGSNTPSIQPAPAKPAYWTKRRVAIVSIGFALAGTGAAMWVKGKDIANSNYNPNACQSALLSGGVGTGLNPAGDAAVGMYCNEAVPSTERKAGLVLMVAGGPVSLLGFLLHRR